MRKVDECRKVRFIESIFLSTVVASDTTVLDIYDQEFWKFRHSLTLHLHHFFSQLNMSMASSVPSGESSHAIATQFVR